MQKIEASRLADLHTPRCGHSTFCTGQEIVVADRTSQQAYVAGMDKDKGSACCASTMPGRRHRSSFRIFKEATDMTTREWLNQQQG